MKTYLITYGITYGEYQHHDYGIVRATEKNVLDKATEWGKNFICEGSGQTFKVRSYEAIPSEHEDIIRHYSLAY